MKKRYLIVFGVGVLALVGGLQWKTLRGLEKENQSLAKREDGAGMEPNPGGPETKQANASQRTIPQVAGISSEEVAEFNEDVIGLFLQTLEGKKTEEMRQQWIDSSRQAQSFSSSNISEFEILFLSDERIPESDGKFDNLREEILGEVLDEVIAPAAPFQMLAYLLEKPGPHGMEGGLWSVFRYCLQKDFELASSLYEQEVAAGNPKFLESDIRSLRSLMLTRLATYDPDKMLTMALDPDFQDDPDIVEKLGSSVEDKMERSADSLRFLQALERVEKGESEENIARLQKLRTRFVRQLGQNAWKQPFDEIKTLVSQGFTTDEQYEFFVQQMNRMSDLPETEKWGDWLLGIGADDWAQWAGDRPEFKKHPLVTLLQNSGRSSSDFGGKFLEKMPPGELRDAAMLEFAYGLADWKPAEAEKYLDQLPKSKGKSRLAKKLKKSRK